MDILSVINNTVLDQADVVAGRAGLANQVVWVHIVDHPDIVGWVQPGHLLLMTGYHWPKEEPAQQALIRTLHEHKLAGIVLAVPRFLPHFSDSVRQEADRVGLPLLELPWDIPFSRVTEEIHSRIIQHQHALLARSDLIHRALTVAAASSGNLESLARLMADKLDRDTCFVSNDGLLLGANSMTEGGQQRESAYFGRWREQAGTAIRSSGVSFVVPALERPSHPARLGCAVQVHGSQRALVWMDEHDTAFTDLDHRAIEHAAVVAALHIVHTDALRQREEQLGYALLESLLDGSFLASESSLERARIAGWDPYASYHVALLQPKTGSPASTQWLERLEQWKARAYEALRACSATPLLFMTTSQIYFLLPVSLPLDRFWRSLGVGRQAALAVSRPVHGVEGVAKGGCDVRDLQPHLQWGEVVTFERVLFPRALMGDAEARRLFIEQRIGPLLAAQKNEQLLQTLDVLSSTGFQLTKAAEQLDVHINTLRYRIDRLQALLGRSLDDGPLRLELQVALQFRHLEQNHECSGTGRPQADLARPD